MKRKLKDLVAGNLRKFLFKKQNKSKHNDLDIRFYLPPAWVLQRYLFFKSVRNHIKKKNGLFF